MTIPPDDGRGDRLHHIRTDPALPEDGYQAGQDGTDCHKLGPQPLDPTLNRRLFNVFVFKGNTPGQTMVQGLVQIYYHHYTGLDGDAKKGDKAHPNGDAEVVAQQPLQDQAARHGVEGRTNQHGLGNLSCIIP